MINIFTRYGVLMHEDKDYLKYCLSEIEKIINKYKLVLNKKTKIYKISEGIEFLGFRFIIKNNKIIMRIKNSTKKKFKYKMKIKGKNYESVKASYLGHLKYGTCGYLIYSTIK